MMNQYDISQTIELTEDFMNPDFKFMCLVLIKEKNVVTSQAMHHFIECQQSET